MVRPDLFTEEAIQADVGQTDGIEHAGIGLDDPRSEIAFAGIQRDALGRKAAEGRDIHERGQFVDVAAGSRRRKDGVLERQAGKLDGKVGLSQRSHPFHPGRDRLCSRGDRTSRLRPADRGS